MNAALLLGLASALGYGITDYLAGIAGRAVGVWRSVFYSDLAAFILLSAWFARPCGEACAFASHSGAWLAALDLVSDELAGTATLYPGHGAPAGPGVLADQRRYLLYYRELIRRLSGSEPQLSETAKSELSATLQEFLPDAPLTWMIELGADAVATELAGARATASAS